MTSPYGADLPCIAPGGKAVSWNNPSHPPSGQRLGWQIVAEYTLGIEPGSEQTAQDQTLALLRPLPLPAPTRQKLGEVVFMTVLNIIARIPETRPAPPSLLLRIQVLRESPSGTSPSGSQQRGWGFFLIEKAGRRSDPAGEQPVLNIFVYQE